MNNYFNTNLNLYKSFYYVIKYGGYTLASNYTNISQSTLSSNIIKLEDDLGYKLLSRKKGTLTLTNKGEKLFNNLIKIVDIFDDDNSFKEINIGCLRFIADNYFIEAIKIFKEKYPNVKININITDNLELFQLLKSDKLDIIFSRYPLYYNFNNNIVLEKLLNVENVFACSKEYYEKNISKHGDIFRYKLILPPASEKRRIIEQHLIDNNVNYEVIIEVVNSQLLKELITNSIGIGYINKDSIKDDIKNGSIIIIDIFDNVVRDTINYLYNSINKNPYIKEFIKILKQTIQNIDS